jgi:hypothetical protein
VNAAFRKVDYAKLTRRDIFFTLVEKPVEATMRCSTTGARFIVRRKRA